MAAANVLDKRTNSSKSFAHKDCFHQTVLSAGFHSGLPVWKEQNGNTCTYRWLLLASRHFSIIFQSFDIVLFPSDFAVLWQPSLVRRQNKNEESVSVLYRFKAELPTHEHPKLYLWASEDPKTCYQCPNTMIHLRDFWTCKTVTY